MKRQTLPKRRTLNSSRISRLNQFQRQGYARLSLESLECRRLMVGDIFGKVSEDPNANGISDPNEDRLAGWTVYLDANQNGALDAGEASLVSDGRGEFVFTGLP